MFSYKDDAELKTNDRVKIIAESKEVFELMIEHVCPEDQGVYKCVVINREGEDTTSGRLTVTSKWIDNLFKLF